jgi:hypothetical protein
LDSMFLRFLLFFQLLLLAATQLIAQQWQRFPAEGFTNDWVVDMAYFQGDLYACGFFTLIGGEEANHIARWNGTSWEPLGIGLNDHAHSLFVFDNHLYVTGYFTNAGGEWVYHLARWDGTSWSGVGGGFDGPTLGIGTYQGSLVVSGEFGLAGNTNAKGIARWNGAGWEALGDGFSDPWSPFDIFPHAVLEWDGDLLACGNFRKAGGAQVNGIARWDGETWHPMGSGFNADVLDMIEYEGELLAGGSFTQTGVGAWSRGIARWNGTDWEPLPSQNGSIDGWVHTLRIFDNELYAAGGFEQTASIPATSLNNIARWTGDSWESLGEGLNNPAEAMIIYNDHLLIGGDFTMAGGSLATRLAAWGGGTVGARTGTAPSSTPQVSPNPASDTWHFQSEIPIHRVILLDTRGQEVFDQVIKKQHFSLSTETVSSGIYWVLIELEDGSTHSKKLVKY